MKKTYINPKTSITTLELHSSLMALSQNEKEISEGNAGLVKGESASTRDSYNVWDDDWSK